MSALTSALGLSLLFILAPDILERGKDCTIFNVLDPMFVYAGWMPLFGVCSIVVISFYARIGYLACTKSSEIAGQVLEESAAHQNLSKAQNRITRVMSIVIGVFMTTYGTWFVIYFFTTGIGTRTVFLIQAFAMWFWVVSIIFCFHLTISHNYHMSGLVKML